MLFLGFYLLRHTPDIAPTPQPALHPFGDDASMRQFLCYNPHGFVYRNFSNQKNTCLQTYFVLSSILTCFLEYCCKGPSFLLQMTVDSANSRAKCTGQTKLPTYRPAQREKMTRLGRKN